MPFELTPAEEMVRKITREYCEKYIIPRRKELMTNDLDMWNEEAHRQTRAGLHLHIIPREEGGTGIGYVASCITIEELCAAWPDLAMAIYGEFAYYFAKATGGDVYDKYMPGIIKGDILATPAITEPSGGSDMLGLQAKAKKVDGGWVLNGRKVFQSEGHYCDFVMALFKTGDPNDPKTPGGRSLTAFIVDREFDGFRVGRLENTLGRKGDLTEFIFDNVFVPDNFVVGGERGVGHGIAPVFSAVGDIGRLTICGMLNGISAGCYRTAMMYAKERHLYGRPISELQMIQARIAKMAVDLEATRALTYRVAWLRTKGIRADAEQATAKNFAENAAIRIAEHCVKIHGGYGVLEDYMPHHYYKHVPMRFGAGGTEESLGIMIASAAFNNEANPDLSHNSMETAGWWGRLEW
jgi:alkylation response protein AidB-like acyl-CoA dehydrogenase